MKVFSTLVPRKELCSPAHYDVFMTAAILCFMGYVLAHGHSSSPSRASGSY